MSTLKVSVVSKLSVLAVLCAVLALVFVPKTARAVSMEDITLRYNANDIHTAVEFDVSHFAYVSDNNCVNVFMPNGEYRKVLHLGFDNIYNQVIKIPSKHYITLILTMYVPDVISVADFFSAPHAVNGVVLVDFQSYQGSVYSSYGYSRFYKLTYYNALDYDVDAFLGDSVKSLIYVSTIPASPAYADKQHGVTVCAQSVYVYRKLNTTQEQNDFYKNENNAQNNIKNQNKNGDDNNNPTGKSQTLMDYFKNGIGAIQKMKKTNCNLKLDMGVVKFDEVDMCKLNVPSYVKIISSIFVFTVCLPASIAIVRRIVAVVKEMQQ